MESLNNEFKKIAEGKLLGQLPNPESQVHSSDFDPIRSRKLACGLNPLEAAPHENFTWFNPALHQGQGRTEAEGFRKVFEAWASSGSAPKGKKFITALGGVGIGKSELAKTAVWKLTPEWHDRHSYYITAYDFDKQVKDFASSKQNGSVSVDPDIWVERLAATENLVIDDVGAGYIDKGWTQSRLERLIDLRHMYKLPTVIISNLSQENLQAEIGSRAFSRLTDRSMGVMLELTHLLDVRQLGIKERKR